MNTKIRFLSITMMLALIVNIISPWTQMTVQAADETELQIEDGTLYDQLKECLMNRNLAAVRADDTTQTITLLMDEVTYIEVADVAMSGNSKDILEQLFTECTSLQTLRVINSDLSTVDFSGLDGRSALKELKLYSCELTSVPDITLPNLEDLYLSSNNFSGANACDSINTDNFGSLMGLRLDNCGIADLSFLGGANLPSLKSLILSQNHLTDASLEQLIDAKDNFPALITLWLGGRYWNAGNIFYVPTQEDSSNQFTDVEKLASLLSNFQNLTTLDLSALGITSLQDFVSVGDDIRIDFTANKISDFAGLEGKEKFEFDNQHISLSGNFAPGHESELPDLLRKVLDPNDPLGKGTVNYNNCSLSDDGTKLVIRPNVGGASVTISGGKLNGSTIEFSLKQVPPYTIPQDLTAHVGDTLADVTLPTGFTWKDSTLDVGAAGTKTFKAVYTPQDTNTYIIDDNIDVPVTVTERDKLLPTYTVPQDLTAHVGDTLADVTLPEGFTWKDSTLDVGAAGTKTFKAVYTPQDTDTYAVVDNIDVPVMVTERDKLLPTYTVPQDLTAHVGDTLADVTLPEGFTWKDASLDVGAAGIKTFKAVYTPQDTDTYAVVDNIDVPVTVTERDKLLPTYTIPQDLTANVGDTLADVALPEGFTWKDSTLDVGAAGTNTFKAVYTPQDTDTYAVVDNIDVPVTVKAPAVDHEEDDDDDTEEAAEVTAVISAKTSDASLILPIAVLLLVSGVTVCIVVSYILIYKKKKTM